MSFGDTVGERPPGEEGARFAGCYWCSDAVAIKAMTKDTYPGLGWDPTVRCVLKSVRLKTQGAARITATMTALMTTP